MQVQLDFGQAGFKELCTCLYFEFKEQLPGKTLKSDKKNPNNSSSGRFLQCEGLWFFYTLLKHKSLRENFAI